MLHARIAQVQLIPSVLLAIQGIFYNQIQLLALTPAQMAIGRILQIILAQVVIIPAHNAQVLLILNALPVIQGMFCSHRQPHV